MSCAEADGRVYQHYKGCLPPQILRLSTNISALSKVFRRAPRATWVGICTPGSAWFCSVRVRWNEKAPTGTTVGRGAGLRESVSACVKPPVPKTRFRAPAAVWHTQHAKKDEHGRERVKPQKIILPVTRATARLRPGGCGRATWP